MYIASFVIAYFICACVSFYVLYVNGLDWNFRLQNSYNKDESSWRYFVREFKAVKKIFVYDFFLLHCPWSKEISIKYRVKYIRAKFRRGYTHEKGWTLADCRHTQNHAQIAYDCFISRTRFWAKNLFNFVTAPVELYIRMLLLCIIAVALFFGWLWECITPSKEKEYGSPE